MNFADRVITASQKKGAPICVALDTRLDKIPNFLQKKWRKKKGKTFQAAAEAILEFNKNIIDAICDYVIAVQINPSFYEVFASEGIYAYRETIKYAQKKGLLVIADLRISVFGPAAESAAAAHLGMINLFGELTTSLGADAVILNAYSGFDGIQPFLDKAEHYKKGVFIIMHTDNIGANELQEIPINERRGSGRNEKLYEKIAELIEKWGHSTISTNNYSSVGALVGSNFSESVDKIREIMPHAICLITHYNQFVNQESLHKFFDERGNGGIIGVSQSVIYAYENSSNPEEKYAESAEKAVKRIRDEVSFIAN